MEKQIKKIVPEYDKNEFLRKALIEFANDDIPLDVFEQDFSNITTIEHLILDDSVVFTADWQANIGNNREESYQDVENYTERIPYTEYRYVYVKGVKEYHPETKYRNEQRQRMVTKSRTVTDWSFSHGTRSDVSYYIGEVIPNIPFNNLRFLEDFSETSQDNIIPMKKDEIQGMEITDALLATTMPYHRSNISDSIERNLPGDEAKDVDFNLSVFERTSTYLIKAEEYEISVNYKGTTYKKRAFPFGNMRFEGDKISNPESAESVKEKIENDAQQEIEYKTKANKDRIIERKIKFHSNIFKKSIIPASISILTLIFSIVASLCIPYIAVVISAFALAVVAFVVSFFLYHIIKKKENFNTDIAVDAINANTDEYKKNINEKAKEKINNYAKERKAKILVKLNEKLRSLGLSEASENEIKEGGNN